MKTIIAGSRDVENYDMIKCAVNQSTFQITEVVSGGARGVDRLGERYAKENNIPVKQFIPNWDLGKKAGILRNVEMANYAEALIAIWDGQSRGTYHMIETAKNKGLQVYVLRV